MCGERCGGCVVKGDLHGKGGTCVVKGACMVGGHVWWWGCVHGRGHV